MTYPIRTSVDLAASIMEMVRNLPPESTQSPLVEVELRDGTQWQVDGVKTDVDQAGVVKTFVLCVGPKEEK